MNVIPRIFYTFNATDIKKPLDANAEYVQKTDIPATAGFDNPADYRLFMCGPTKLRTTRELINLAKNFCANIHDYDTEYIRPTYEIEMKRNAYVYMHDNHLGGSDIDNKIKLTAANDGIFTFIYSKTNKLIYPSNICEILQQDIKHFRLENPDWSYAPLKHPRFLDFNLEEGINLLRNPLYVYKYDNETAFVKPILYNTIIVNDKLCEIYPKATKHIPSHMSHLFNNKTEPVKQSLKQKYR